MSSCRVFERVSVLSLFLLGSLVAVSPGVASSSPDAVGKAEPSVERGRYLVEIAGCNDCHTEGYMETNGEVPEDQWLTGSSLGWRGPWGTTYASNLRIALAAFDEDEWVETVQEVEYLPPMPWPSLHRMEENDLRSIYRFVRQLGPLGESAPSHLPPGVEPETPFALFPSPPSDAE